MKELKRTRTIEEIYSYEAFDGKHFDSKEECEKYEKTAEAVITKEFRSLMVDGEEFSECYIWEHYGYGSDEYCMAILDIKTEKELEIANRYYEIVTKGTSKLIGTEYIGKRILVNTGSHYDRYVNANPITEEELIEQFKKDIAYYFRPEDREVKAE